MGGAEVVGRGLLVAAWKAAADEGEVFDEEVARFRLECTATGVRMRRTTG